MHDKLFIIEGFFCLKKTLIYFINNASSCISIIVSFANDLIYINLSFIDALRFKSFMIDLSFSFSSSDMSNIYTFHTSFQGIKNTPNDLSITKRINWVSLSFIILCFSSWQGSFSQTNSSCIMLQLAHFPFNIYRRRYIVHVQPS